MDRKVPEYSLVRKERRSFSLRIQSNWRVQDPGGGGCPNIKGVGMLVVSLRGINFGIWSHLGCSGQNAIIFSLEGLV